MRNPNGYGTVFKLRGNLRRPWVARKTTGYNENGNPIYLVVGYFEKRTDALIALAEFNGRDINVPFVDMTLRLLYVRWRKEYWDTMSKTNQGKINAAYKWMEPLENRPYRSLRHTDMQACINRCPNKTSAKRDILLMFRRLDEMADRDGIITKRMSQFIKVEVIPAKERSIFTDDEIRTLFRCTDEFAEIVLMLIFTGFRKTELLTLKPEDVRLEERYIKGGIKTKAGKGRIVPIHRLISGFIEKRLKNEGGTLLGLTAYRFQTEWDKLMARLNMEHTSHECRHTFRSMLDNTDGNRKCINLIMGHSSGEDTGERIYTHKTLKQLVETVDLITFNP